MSTGVVSKFQENSDEVLVYGTHEILDDTPAVALYTQMKQVSVVGLLSIVTNKCTGDDKPKPTSLGSKLKDQVICPEYRRFSDVYIAWTVTLSPFLIIKCGK